MRLNRKWILVLSLLMSVAMATSGTLAYLTDRDSRSNVLTLGNVDIRLDEEFNQGSTLLPGIDVTKTPTVENIGKNDAWVWITVAVPDALAQYVTTGNIGNGWIVGDDVEDDNLPDYTLKMLKYESPLAVGGTTSNAFEILALSDSIDVDANGKLCSVENGVSTPIEWNITTNGDPTVYVSAYAIQKDDFDTVDAAIEAYNVQWGGNGSDYSVPATVSSTAELAAALESGSTVIVLEDGNYEIPGVIAGKNVTLVGSGDKTVFDFTKVHNVGGASITFENMKFQGKNENVMNGFGVQSTTGTIVYKNCTFDGAVTNEHYGNVSYSGCTFTGTGYITTYAVKSASFTNCTFDKADSRALLVYSHGDNPVKVTVDNCDFMADAKGYTYSKDWTAAVEVDTTNIPTSGTTVTVKNCSYDGNYSGMVRDKSTTNKNAVIVQENNKQIITISTADQLLALADQQLEGTYSLGANIDMDGYEMKAIAAAYGKSLSFYGNGHTIFNLNIVSGANDNTTGQAALFYTYTNSTLNVSDLKLENVTVTSDKHASGYAAAVIGYCEGAATLNNVDVAGANITGFKSSGALVGHLSAGASLTAADCDLAGRVTLNEYPEDAPDGHYAGKFFGTIAATAQLTNCTANVTIGGALHPNNNGDAYGRIVSPGILNQN